MKNTLLFFSLLVNISTLSASETPILGFGKSQPLFNLNKNGTITPHELSGCSIYTLDLQAGLNPNNFNIFYSPSNEAKDVVFFRNNKQNKVHIISLRAFIKLINVLTNTELSDSIKLTEEEELSDETIESFMNFVEKSSQGKYKDTSRMLISSFFQVIVNNLNKPTTTDTLFSNLKKIIFSKIKENPSMYPNTKYSIIPSTKSSTR